MDKIVWVREYYKDFVGILDTQELITINNFVSLDGKKITNLSDFKKKIHDMRVIFDDKHKLSKDEQLIKKIIEDPLTGDGLRSVILSSYRKLGFDKVKQYYVQIVRNSKANLDSRKDAINHLNSFTSAECEILISEILTNHNDPLLNHTVHMAYDYKNNGIRDKLYSILENSKDVSEQTQYEVIYALSNQNPTDEITKYLTDLIVNVDTPTVLYEGTLKALAKLDAPKALPLIYKGLHSTDEVIVYQAIHAAQIASNREIASKLVDMLESEHPDAGEIAHSLTYYNDPTILEKVKKIYPHLSPNNARWATKILLAFNDFSSIPLLEAKAIECEKLNCKEYAREINQAVSMLRSQQ
ncbi:MAG: HEAT repeat domain-containing protein [Candidatus Wallbacteria bacterium]|nr:HEAT repeat domain-containing protein [Candidatus Wallbacteria bacterium]